MGHINQKPSKRHPFQLLFQLSLMGLFLSSLIACASTPSASSPPEVLTSDNKNTASSEPFEADNAAMKNEKVNEAPATMAEPMVEQMPEAMADQSSDKMPASVPDKTTTAHTTASCKAEPYGQYEKQARASLVKGLKATTEGKYGVGFRNKEEHKKWSDTHTQLFKSVNQACGALSQCAKQHPKNKVTECASQATLFNEWQNLAKRFAQNAKLSETTQPPKICSFTPNLEDAASCFHSLGDNLDKACNSPDCKQASDCWRSIGFLDFAINQATSACNFARTPLAECRGYVTATKRRTAKFQRCSDMQEQLSITVFPTLKMNNDY